ncbi:site-2 protease family protein [Nocardioides zeae]|uniref:endopeptidase La n=1 Tax=Nocardioides imazamoxiresistens TaxID=3231893 RepID=A0ABU3PWY8_9ACTN|nr:PDZ domain-containing protein [Nocardioides zeae]MDT9593752.1 site-2 protease family protein [Nocardioides zeae]
MTQRTLAGVVAVPLVAALWAAALFLPAPFVTYYPGTTADLIGPEHEGGATITVEDHEVYPPTSGELRMTTASITRPETRLTLAEALSAWLDRDATVRPYSSEYGDGEDDETNQYLSGLQMTSSADLSVAAALTELDIAYETNVQVGGVRQGYPADGLLQSGDVVRSVDGEPIEEPADIAAAVERAGVGAELVLEVERDGETIDVTVVPAEDEGAARIGVTPILGFDFPFPISLTPPEGIGGGSAGMMFALAVYDYLTPGDLTGGLDVAGTGTIALDGTVGRIGGITQKIPGARDAGSAVFLAPAGNCDEAVNAANGDMRVVAVETLDEAIETLGTLADDPDADVTTCEDVLG